MESSDDSFAWSDASTCSNTGNGSDDKGTMSGSECNKKYKKILQKKLFKEESEADVKHALLNGKVKRELESQEHDAPRSPTPLVASRKRKHEPERSSSQESEPELHLLEKCVKRERNISQTHNDTYYENGTKNKTFHNDFSQVSEESINSFKSVNKNKKSKRKRENISFDNDETDLVVEEKFEAHEAFVSSRPKNRINSEHAQETEHVNYTEKAHKSKKAKKKKQEEHDRHSQIDSEVELEKFDHDGSLSIVEDDNILENESTIKDLNHTATKISDRIQFEDEEQLETEYIQSANSHSSKFQRFLKTNPHLQAIKGKRNWSALLQGEDIWLLTCPREIDIESLKGVDISLDSKCKLKTNSQTYIGNTQNENSRIPIFIYDHKKPVVKNVSINGIVNFHKRIPKAHYVDDNVIQNQSDFIPLPETKSRHPLFGPDYKKAIKIPSAVKARLNHSSIYSDRSVIVERKKKRKRNECKKESLEITSQREEEVDGGEGSGQSGCGVRRKRHRTTQDDSQPAHKKKKKTIIQEVSIGSWDSEKAIEETLFNF